MKKNKKLIIKTWKMKKNRKVSYQNLIKFVLFLA